MADITATNTLPTTRASDSEALAQTALTPATSAAEATPATGQRDTAETATDDAVPTKDGGTWLGRLTATVTHGAKLGADKAWEYTASAQRQANEQAKQTRAPQPEPKPEPEPKPGEHGALDKLEHAYHTVHAGVHVAHVLDQAQSVVRNFGAIRRAGTDFKEALNILHHGEITHGQIGGRIVKGAGVAFFAVDATINAKKILDDITDADGLSIDSLQPIADTAASAIGTFGGPLGTAFSLGYQGGKMLDEYAELGKKIDRAHDRSITQRTQIGFLEDRAREMSLGALVRLNTGAHTRRDAMRVRSIVREAREHGILDANGRVDRAVLWSMLSKGAMKDLDRIANGIESAAAHEQDVNRGPW